LALFGKPGKKSGYVLLCVEFDGSLRDGTTTTTKKGKENCQDDAEMSPHEIGIVVSQWVFLKKKEQGVQNHSQLRKFYEHGKHFK
jgi:hypothetical protein